MTAYISIPVLIFAGLFGIAVALAKFATERIQLVPKENLYLDKSKDERLELAVDLERWHSQHDLRDRWRRPLLILMWTAAAEIFYYFVILKNIHISNGDATAMKYILVAFLAPLYFFYLHIIERRAHRLFDEQKVVQLATLKVSQVGAGIGLRSDHHSVKREVAAAAGLNPFPTWYKAAFIGLIVTPIAILMGVLFGGEYHHSNSTTNTENSEALRYSAYFFIFYIAVIFVARQPLAIQIRHEVQRRIANRRMPRV